MTGPETLRQDMYLLQKMKSDKLRLAEQFPSFKNQIVLPDDDKSFDLCSDITSTNHNMIVNQAMETQTENQEIQASHSIACGGNDEMIAETNSMSIDARDMVKDLIQ